MAAHHISERGFNTFAFAFAFVPGPSPRRMMDELSAYELQRAQTIAENAAVLEKLGLKKLVKKRAAPQRQKRPRERQEPKRASQRQRQLPAATYTPGQDEVLTVPKTNFLSTFVFARKGPSAKQAFYGRESWLSSGCMYLTNGTRYVLSKK